MLLGLRSLHRLVPVTFGGASLSRRNARAAALQMLRERREREAVETFLRSRVA